MQCKLRRALGAMKDQTSISLAKIVNTNSSNLDVAVLKATTRDPEPIDERYVDEILDAIASNKLHAAICVNAIAKRIGKTTNWVVALKSLMLVLRIFQDGDPFFPQEVLDARNRGAKILNLTTFKDYSHSSPYDYTAFVRSFAFYLDQRLDCFITGKLQIRFTKEEKKISRQSSRRVNEQPVREMKPPMLLDRISYWQRLLDRAIATKPVGAAKDHGLVHVSLYAIIRESFDLYRDISDGLGLLLDGFFHLPHQSCIDAFEYCVKATKQIEQLSSFYDYCKDLGVGKAAEYPRVQMISEELMEILQEFLKDQASFPSYTSPCLLHAPAPQDDDPEESQFGLKITPLEDLMHHHHHHHHQTDFDGTMNLSLSPAHFSEFAGGQCLEQEDMYNVHETGSNHSLPIVKETSVKRDFVSFDDWLMSDSHLIGDNKTHAQNSATTNASNGETDCLELALVDASAPNVANGHSLLNEWIQQDHGPEQGFENVANLVNNWLKEIHIEQASQNEAKGDAFASDWLREDKEELEEQWQNSASNSRNDSYKEGWEVVFDEATPQPAQASQHLADGIEPSLAIDLFDQRTIVPQPTYNPFLEDGTTISTFVATTSPSANTSFPDELSMEPTFQATPPTLIIHGPNEMVVPTFQAMPTLSDDPIGTTTMLEVNEYSAFAPWPTMKASNNTSFNETDDLQNLFLQQELQLQNQNKIMERQIVSSNLE